MLLNALQKIFGSKNERELNRLQPLIRAINDLEPAISQLNDPQLQAKTVEFRERLGRGKPLKIYLRKPSP